MVQNRRALRGLGSLGAPRSSHAEPLKFVAKTAEPSFLRKTRGNVLTASPTRSPDSSIHIVPDFYHPGVPESQQMNATKGFLSNFLFSGPMNSLLRLCCPGLLYVYCVRAILTSFRAQNVESSIHQAQILQIKKVRFAFRFRFSSPSYLTTR